MNKNDKIIAVVGVIILVFASIGIYTWVPKDTARGESSIENFFKISSDLKEIPEAISVSQCNPFYPLIATPLCVHYDKQGNREIIPLYVENITNPSKSISRIIDQIGRDANQIIDNTMTAKNWSIEIAKNYWENSDAALIIQDNESGYCLGVIATPIASYLSIPVIVTDELDDDIKNVLSELEVEKTLICGDIEGYGNYLKFNSVEEIVDSTIDLLMEKFGKIDYMTLTNPIDAWPPEVLDSKTFHIGPVTLKSAASTQLIQYALYSLPQTIDSFTIPNDYKYALIEFEGVNHDDEDVDELGDYAMFQVGANLEDIPEGLQNYELFVGTTSYGGVADRDSNGNIIKDKMEMEAVVYDRGGVEYNVMASGTWLAKNEGEVSATVTVKKLENPVYPMMKGLSSIAPYLTAYHKGLVFGKPEFAFTADDDVITENGKTSPGFYMPRRNTKITGPSNEHIYDKIHIPLNNLLAKLANIDLLEEKDLENLQNHYKENPINIALVGGATVLPQYIYQNAVEPVDYEETEYYFGAGTPSDVIYGNIDPKKYDWSNLADDIYTEYPFQENIVGRITGWDSQDASALILRSIFYNDIITKLGDWKDNFGILIGAGQDFQKPLIRYLILGDILQLTPRGEPMKYPTGYGEIAGERTNEEVAKPMGFDTTLIYDEAAMMEGLSDEALDKIKKVTLLNRIFFHKLQVKNLIGEGVVQGGEIMENSNYIWANAHGSQHLFGMAGTELTAAGFGGPVLHWILKQAIPVVMGGFAGPGGSLGSVGDYTTRNVQKMEFGPSFMFLESCICGKIDGMYPQANVGQGLLHSGVGCLIASPTGSNIGGGYLEPKDRMYDTPLSVLRSYIKAKIEARQGIYPDPHFGYKIYTDLCMDLKENDVSVGEAFRNAKNNYLPSDADWELWWSPPLVSTGSVQIDSELQNKYSGIIKNTASNGKGPMLENKYISYQEYLLFGDPAFNPYEPINEGHS